MFGIDTNWFKKETQKTMEQLISELCGDDFEHGQAQVSSTLAQLESSLSYKEDEGKNQKMCFMLQARGFWAHTLEALPFARIDEATAALTDIPVYVYVLEEGASYKVAISSRYLHNFFEEKFSYYTGVLSGLDLQPVNTGTCLSKSMYSSDLLSILSSNYANCKVFKVLP